MIAVGIAAAAVVTVCIIRAATKALEMVALATSVMRKGVIIWSYDHTSIDQRRTIHRTNRDHDRHNYTRQVAMEVEEIRGWTIGNPGLADPSQVVRESFGIRDANYRTESIIQP